MIRGTSPTAVMVIMLLLAAVVYWPGLHGGFVLDDFSNIVDVGALHVTRLNSATLIEAAVSGNASPLLRPAASISFALNYYLFGPNPFSFKLVNLVIHLANGFLLYLLGRIVLTEVAVVPESRQPLALAAAAVWLVHPLNLTSVLYIVQRMTSLASLFILAGLLCYAVGRRRMLRERGGRVLALGGLCSFGLLALATKEIAVLLPVYMLVIEATVFRWRTATSEDRNFLRVFFIIFAALPVLLGGLYLLSRPEWFIEGYQGRAFTMIERLMTEARVLWFYLALIIYPDISRMGLYHDDIAISTALLSPPSTLPAILGIIALLGGALASLKRWPILAFAILWFLGGHLLESTALPLEIAHEHRNYLPAYGPLLALMGTLSRLVPVGASLWRRYVLPVIFLAVAAANTNARALQWQDFANLTYAEAVNHPYSLRAQVDLGEMYGQLYQATGEAQYLNNARKILERGATLEPDDIHCLLTLVTIYGQNGKEPDPKWIEEVKHRLGAGVPFPAQLKYLQDLVFCQRKSCRTPSQDMESMLLALAGNPRDTPHIRAMAYNLLAVWESDRGDKPAAGRYMHEAVTWEPGNALLHIGLSNWYLDAGDKQSALSELEIAQHLDPLGIYRNWVNPALAAVSQGTGGRGK